MVFCGFFEGGGKGRNEGKRTKSNPPPPSIRSLVAATLPPLRCRSHIISRRLTCGNMEASWSTCWGLILSWLEAWLAWLELDVEVEAGLEVDGDEGEGEKKK